MRILITGASGMLGSTLVKYLQKKFDVYATSRSDFEENHSKNFLRFDLLEDSYDRLMGWADPDLVIHAGAITDLDYAEDNINITHKINGESVKKFLSDDFNSRIIFISSDAVFSENIHMAKESDVISPHNVYGKSKQIGENYLLEAGEPHLVLRTTILGKNLNVKKVGFLEWMINSIKNGERITLFDDAIFTPITIWNLCDELEWIIKNSISGAIHISSDKGISKYNLGIKVCKKMELDWSLINRGSINDFSFKAKRANDQSLNSENYFKLSNRKFISIDDIVNSIVKNFI